MKQNKITKSARNTEAQSGPTKLEAAINRFLDRCQSKKETNETFMDMLHYTMENDVMDNSDRFKRGNYMFMFREVCALINATYKYRRTPDNENLTKAIHRFMYRCQKEHTNEILFNLLHYSISCPTLDECTREERDSIMFFYREISLLTNAVYKQKESEVRNV